MNDNRILFVDDDPKVLAAIERQFEDKFHIEIAEGPAEGIKAVEERGPFALVISDMRMPEMTGIEMLAKIKSISPNTVRMMLTGFADLETTIDAINRGSIFRFLSKPCPNDILDLAIGDGLRQHQLILAEKQLVEGTLMGSIKVLSDVLGLVNPIAFGRASRVKQIAMAVASQMQINDVWEVEIAAMLSAIGCVTLPKETLEKLTNGEQLTESERDCLDRHPAVGKGLLQNIPRLENVAQIVEYQEKHFDGGGVPKEDPGGDKIPTGARILKAALDLDLRIQHSEDPVCALASLKKNANRYDPAVLSAMEPVIEELYRLKAIEMTFEEIRTGMVFAKNVLTIDGRMLIAQGQEATVSALKLLENFAGKNTLSLPLMVFRTN